MALQTKARQTKDRQTKDRQTKTRQKSKAKKAARGKTRILGIETSCDDTGVAVVQSSDGFFLGETLFLKTLNQHTEHQKFGGIAPEPAARAHTERLLPLIEEALSKIPLEQIDAIAVTSRPGLFGSLQTGFVTAQTLGLFWKKPVIGVNHIEAHIFSPFLKEPLNEGKPTTRCDATGRAPTGFGPFGGEEESASFAEAAFPFLALIASGGCTHLYYVKDFNKSSLLGATLDDAAGEALDKFGKMLNLPWPGGPHADRLAASVQEREEAPYFPKKIQTKNLSFSFSGLKSAARRLLESRSPQWAEENKARLCAAYQKAVVDHLMEKLKAAQKLTGAKRIVLAGGVSANSLLRRRFRDWSAEAGAGFLPAKAYCGDNGAMIAGLGLHYFLRGLEPRLICRPRHLDRDFFSDERDRPSKPVL